MQLASTEQQEQQRLTCSRLPLAVYREVAAHLRQVKGVDTKLIMRSVEHDPTEKFDYYQSQVAAIEISYGDKLLVKDQEIVKDILDYYAQRYSPWEELNGDE